MDGTVLVADDDRTIRTVLTQALTRAGCKVHATASMVTLLRWVEEGKGDLVVSDVVMPDGNGLDALPHITKARPNLPVIIISAQNTIMTAIHATQKDAYDYLPKPFDLPDLMKRCAKALETKRKSPAVSQPPVKDEDELPLVGRTVAMQALYRLIARVMNTDLSVLILGESGTGKSLVARAIHDFSDRRSLPFVVVGERDLEGVDGPANVLSRVRGGTLVFDEIGDLSLDAQARVVRMLDSMPEPAPRVMAANQSGLAERTERGLFREDLFYRMSGVTLSVPPLRERVEDIELLAAHFLSRSDRTGDPAKFFSHEAMNLIRNYSWPGNVRQFEHAIKRLVVTVAEEQITEPQVETMLRNQPAVSTTLRAGEGEKLSASVFKHLRRYFDLHGGELPPDGLYGRILREIEMPLIEIALDATGGNQAKCADLLGINRNTLRKKITDLDIEVTRRRKLM